LASNVSLRDLTVRNTGTGLHNVGLMASSGAIDIRVSEVEAQSQGNSSTDTNNYAIYLTGNGTHVTLQSVNAFAKTANLDAIGLYNASGTTATLLSGSYIASNGSELSIGISNQGSIEAHCSRRKFLPIKLWHLESW